MPKNQSNKGTDNRCDYLADIANNYNRYEKYYNGYEKYYNGYEKYYNGYDSVLEATVNKVKTETKAVNYKLKDVDKDLRREYGKE